MRTSGLLVPVRRTSRLVFVAVLRVAVPRLCVLGFRAGVWSERVIDLAFADLSTPVRREH